MILEDLFLVICHGFTMYEIIGFELISKQHMNIIRGNPWYKEISVRSDTILEHVFRNYKPMNLVIGCFVSVNYFIDKLSECYALNLYGTNITPGSLKLLTKCRILDIRSCKNLTLENTDDVIGLLKSNGCVVYH